MEYQILYYHRLKYYEIKYYCLMYHEIIVRVVEICIVFSMNYDALRFDLRASIFDEIKNENWI